MVDIEVNCKTKVDAEKAGIEFMLETLVDAKDKAATMTEEEKEKIRKSAIKEGWDIS